MSRGEEANFVIPKSSSLAPMNRARTAVFASLTMRFHRRVALRLIKAGMDTKQVIARFESEREALAMMDHQPSPKCSRLEKQKRVLSADHTSIADALVGLGGVLNMERRYAEAKPMLREGLTIN